jgi:hypothetical protein
MNFSDFEELPDYLSPEVLKVYFNQIIDYYENTRIEDYADLTEAIFQLSVRQWHTYKCLDKQLKAKVDLIIKEILDPYSYELMDNVTSIIAHLGLKESFQKLKEIERTNLSVSVKILLEETINELEGKLDNPYSGLE